MHCLAVQAKHATIQGSVRDDRQCQQHARLGPIRGAPVKSDLLGLDLTILDVYLVATQDDGNVLTHPVWQPHSVHVTPQPCTADAKRKALGLDPYLHD